MMSMTKLSLPPLFFFRFFFVFLYGRGGLGWTGGGGGEREGGGNYTIYGVGGGLDRGMRKSWK